MIFCPFCDGQGLIDKAKIIGKGIQIYICEEYDTMWKSPEIREDNCLNLWLFYERARPQGLMGRAKRCGAINIIKIAYSL